MEKAGDRRLVYRGRNAAGATIVFAPPTLLAGRFPNLEAPAFLEAISDFDDLGIEFMLLLQAGAAAIGVFDDGELILHKVIKKYVVRGQGRAQPAHLKTKGKSRYGSRLRLQNWKSLLEEVSERLQSWIDEAGEPDLFLTSCPQRTWPELVSAGLPAVLAEGEVRCHLPFDIHKPNFEELLRARKLAETGELTIDPVSA